jgi:NADPH:quinone reductase-like Zn-dependent oxidoreductase
MQDYDVARGNTQSNRNLGLECAGMISRIGANAKHNFQVGDHVLCWSPGSLATHVCINARYCIKLPDALPLDQAVTMSTAHAAMIRGLVELCNLSMGESVLIHPAAGADGAAAIRIARMLGAEVGYFFQHSVHKR